MVGYNIEGGHCADEYLVLGLCDFAPQLTYDNSTNPHSFPV